MWPQLSIDLEAIAGNAAEVCRRCSAAGISVTAVTKGLSAQPQVASAMVEGGCTSLGDSRLENLVKLRQAGIKVPLYMIRIPMISQLQELIHWADGSLISSLRVLEELERCCASARIAHQVMVMVDLGDLREGIWPHELPLFARALKGCRWVEPLGVAVNFGCYGATLPTREQLAFLVQIRDELARELDRPLKVCSGGASSTLPLLERGQIPPGINNLRVGEAILLGHDTNTGGPIPWLSSRTMYLQAEVVEVRIKPSVPVGEIGYDAFGGLPSYNDRGERLRAIVAVGRQDVQVETLEPLDEGVEILGASSDHMILDVDALDPPPREGDRLRFSVNYSSMLMLSTSPYVAQRVTRGGHDPRKA